MAGGHNFTIRVKRFINKIGRNLKFYGKETIGFDKTNVECYNCHRRCHFARECRALRNQGNRNGDNTKKVVLVETLANALVVQDGMGSSSSSSSDTEFRKALKEKDDLKLKLENFEESSKNLTKLINSQISAKDKTCLGYDDQMNESELNMKKSEVVHSVFNSRESDVDDNPVNERFKTVRKTTTIVPETSISKTSKDIVEKSKIVRPMLTMSGQVQVDAPKQCSHRAAVSDSFARRVNTAAHRPNVNDALLTYSYFKAHSPAIHNMLLQDQGIVFLFDSGCSRHMTGNKFYLSDYQEIDGGFVAFEGSPKGGKITGKGKIRTGKLDFEAIYFVKELKFNLFSVSQMCDMKNSVLFHLELNVFVSISYFKLLDETSNFSWVFFLATKDETPEILKNFITGIENQIDHKVKTIRCDNGIEFKNRIMNEFCKIKGIRREFSIARTPQQNGVAERKNRTLIEVARTMLADSKLPTTFWAEAVNTACYVQNRMLVVKPHNKTPYELFLGIKPALSFMRPFGCPVTILNTLDHLGLKNLVGQLSKVEGCGGLRGSQLSWGDKEVTMQYLELKGGDIGASKLLGDIRVRSWWC
ncbi:ribonuclease H-like domain-containing protein [Tanacetum coccineum]